MSGNPSPADIESLPLKTTPETTPSVSERADDEFKGNTALTVSSLLSETTPEATTTINPDPEAPVIDILGIPPVTTGTVYHDAAAYKRFI